MRQEPEVDLHERLARQLDWNLLRTFIAIVQYGGISRAAEHIHLTQSAVSHALKRLEEQLNCKLIERTARRFEVTHAGQMTYARAVEIHNQISRLRDISQTDSTEIFGHLRLLFASRLQSARLDRLLRDFNATCPRVTIHIDVLPSYEIQALLQQGLASAGLCLLRGHPPGLQAQLFMEQTYGLYCGMGHRLFGRADVQVGDLIEEDLVTFPSDQMGGVLSPLTIYREQHSYQGRVAATSWNLDELIRLVEIGLGIGLLPMHVAASLTASGRLWQLAPVSGIGPINIHLVWNDSTEMRPAEKAFIKLAMQSLAHGDANPKA